MEVHGKLCISLALGLYLPLPLTVTYCLSKRHLKCHKHTILYYEYFTQLCWCQPKIAIASAVSVYRPSPCALSCHGQTDQPDTELTLTCAEFDLLPGDYIGVHGPGRYSQLSGGSRSPDITSREHILVELITEEAGGGRLRCSVTAQTIGHIGLNHRLCGLTRKDVRIVGGEEAPKNAYPWLVSWL